MGKRNQGGGSHLCLGTLRGGGKGTGSGHGHRLEHRIPPEYILTVLVTKPWHRLPGEVLGSCGFKEKDEHKEGAADSLFHSHFKLTLGQCSKVAASPGGGKPACSLWEELSEK